MRANVDVTEHPLPDDKRFPFMGTKEQIKTDLAAAQELGAAEVHFDPSFSDDGLTLEAFLSSMERMRELAG
jgi:hypothetical protein